MTTTQKLSAGSAAAADVAALLRARNPVLWIKTKEEPRVERFVMTESAPAARYAVKFWDCSQGITNYEGKPVDQGQQATDPSAVLQIIRDSSERCIWVLRDLTPWLRDPSVTRGLRSLARSLTLAPPDSARAVIVLTPSNDIPEELQGTVTVLEWPLPDRAEIAAILDSAIAGLPDGIRERAAPNGTRDAAIDAAVGLTGEEAQACYAKSLVTTRTIDPATVAGEKKRVIAREKVLEWHDPLPGGLASVGGLDRLKAWLESRRSAFSAKARAYGLPAPKGALLVGVPGCGKSLTAKAIASAWGMPLLRLDMGAIKSKYVGDSEANIRAALRVAETVAPCVLWMDEIEKAMAGATQGAADGGVSADALGAVLQWMQDRAGSVFVVATANDVSSLPPELMRKGRFDEIFFIDVPTMAERREILIASLKSFGRSLSDDDVTSVARCTQEFTGAEIAALVPDAMFAAFADEAREVVASDIINAASVTVPLARTASEKITKLRAWAKERCRAASTPDVIATTGARQLDV